MRSRRPAATRRVVAISPCCFRAVSADWDERTITVKSGQSRRTVILALLLASAAAAVAFMFVNSRDGSNAATVPGAPTVPPTTAVLVAKANIPLHTTLTADLLEVKQVAMDQKHPGALSSPDQAIGKVSSLAVLQGEQLLDSSVADELTTPDGLAYKVPIGKRAISIVFDEVMGTGGLVQPGDHVDVIGYFIVQLYTPKPAKASDTPETAFAVGPDGGKLLEQPSKDSTVITDLDPDTEVTVLGAQGRYFRVKVGDQIGWLDANSVVVKDSAGDSGDGAVEYQQLPETHVTTYLVQNVEVLAVSQAISPDEAGVGEPGADATVTAEASASDKAVARPTARSVTLAVTPEEAQRLLLAAQTSSDKQMDHNAGIRLVVRAPGDATISHLPPAEIGTMPIGNALDGINQPLFPSELEITDVEFTQRVVNAGQILEFKVTVKNVSDHTIRGAKTAPPEFTYPEGTAYDTLGFTPEADTYRIGLNLSNAYPTQFPYRWGIGRDLAPGETTTVVGSVQLTDPTAATTYWFGVIHEPEIVTQDGVGVADVTVLMPNQVSVKGAGTPLLADATAGSAVVATLAQGQQLMVSQVRDGWFRVKVGQQEGWIQMSAVDIPTPGADAAVSSVTGSTSATKKIDFNRFNPWGHEENGR
jgi:Flp pilus assembly protein CpaB/SH3-like domain-containing protein